MYQAKIKNVKPGQPFAYTDDRIVFVMLKNDMPGDLRFIGFNSECGVRVFNADEFCYICEMTELQNEFGTALL